MATKKAKQQETTHQTPSTLPAGFERIQTGSFPDNHDFKKEPILRGIVQEIKTSEQKRGRKTEEVKIIYVAETGTGVLSAVWESHALEGLFQQVKKGDEIYIKYNGVKKLKGNKTLKDFEAGIKAK